jgi:Domain of Unknown Function (DUF1080)
MLNRRSFLAATPLFSVGLLVVGCATPDSAGWITLLDAARTPSFDGWEAIGQGNWSFAEGTLQGKAGTAGFLLSKNSYTDFDLRAEFWADPDCNSGIFLRCQSRREVTADNSYEVNIFDKRSDPSYGTAGIVNIAKAPQPYPQAANRWNRFDVSVRGDRIVVIFNGQQTVDVRDTKHKTGPIALQSAGGTIRFRKLDIKPA